MGVHVHVVNMIIKKYMDYIMHSNTYFIVYQQLSSCEGHTHTHSFSYLFSPDLLHLLPPLTLPTSLSHSCLVGIPSALQQTGFLFGVVLLGIVAAITDYTVILLIKNANMVRKHTYQVSSLQVHTRLL